LALSEVLCARAWENIASLCGLLVDGDGNPMEKTNHLGAFCVFLTRPVCGFVFPRRNPKKRSWG
jgi:hypothetical protein